MKVKELIDKYEAAEYVVDFVSGKTLLKNIRRDLEQLDEQKPVKVPQFVTDWIERSKQEKRNLRNALNNGGEKMRLWFLDQENYDLFARAWLDGYEIEKEKRYEVILCNGQSLKTVYRQGSDYLDFEMVYGDLESFTRKQLEEAGFGWVFSCEGIEIEEVE